MRADKTKVMKLLKIVKGQIDGLIKMVEEDRYCIDISTQLLASQSLLKKLNLEILTAHFQHCIKESIENKDTKDSTKKIEEVLNILNNFLK